MAERSTYDALLDLLNPLPREAEAALWPQVVKLLEELGPKAWKALDPKSKAALEMATEAYPATKGVALGRVKAGVGSGYWQGRPASIEQWLSGTPPTQSPLLDSMVRDITHDVRRASPQGFVGIDPTNVIGTTTPASIYAHEVPGHVFHGPLNDWSNVPNINIKGSKTPTWAVKEGFADAIGQSLRGVFGDNATVTYWPQVSRMAPKIKEPYLASSRLGKDVGSTMRAGKMVDQEDIIKSLLDIIARYKGPTDIGL